MGKFFKYSLLGVFLLLLLVSLAVCGGSFSSTAYTGTVLSGIEVGDDEFAIDLVMADRDKASVLIHDKIKLIARYDANYYVSSVGFSFLINSIETYDKVLIELRLDDEIVSSMELSSISGNLEQTVELEIYEILRTTEEGTMFVDTENDQTLTINILYGNDTLKCLIWGFNIG